MHRRKGGRASCKRQEGGRWESWRRHHREEEDSRGVGGTPGVEEDRFLQNEWDNLPEWRVAAVAEVQAQDSSRGRCSCRSSNLILFRRAGSMEDMIRSGGFDMMVVGEREGERDGVGSAKRSSPGLHSD